MSFKTMLNHRCDIYHVIREGKSPGYGLPESPSFSYPDTSDAENVVCHFNIAGVQNGVRAVVQNEPQANYEAGIKLAFLVDEDVRLNDRIVDKQTGYEYTAGIPVRVRDHHQYVTVRRTTEQEPL